MSTTSIRPSRTIALLATSTAVAATAGIASLAPVAHAAAAPVPARVTASTSNTAAAGWIGVQAQAPHARTATIELIRPSGQRAASLTVPVGESLVQVSNDGRRVLTEQYLRDTSTWRVHDLVTHRTTSFTGDYTSVRFTSPGGGALLAQPFRAGGVGTAPVVRLDLSGHRQATYAHTEGGAFMPSLDGRFLVGTTSAHQLVVDANASGRVLRTLSSPRGYGYCRPVRNDSASSFEAVCQRNGSGSVSQVFRWSLSGGAPVSLTGALPVGGFGYVDRWVEPSGTWVHGGAGCGSGPLLKVQGRSVRPARLAVRGALVDVVANHAYLESQGCDASTTLSAANLSTGAVTTLFRATPARELDTWVVVDPTR